VARRTTAGDGVETIAILVGCGLFTTAFVIVQLSVRRVDKKLDQVHVLVNSKMTAALAEIETLKEDVRHQKVLLDDRAQKN
jgi:hypothetical protein